MRTLTLLIAGFISTSAFAGGGYLETTDQARQRISADRYEAYHQNTRPPQLGGGWGGSQLERAPYGTERPGYTSPQDFGYGRDRYNPYDLGR